MSDEYVPATEPAGDLVPPRRRPPTAVGVATPPPPPRDFRSFGRRPFGRDVIMEMVFRAAIGMALAPLQEAAELARAVGKLRSP